MIIITDNGENSNRKVYNRIWAKNKWRWIVVLNNIIGVKVFLSTCPKGVSGEARWIP